jgi:hypothetical protein
MDAYTTGGSGLSSSGGDVVADNGATIISSNSQGDDSTMFGSAALREIQAGVANGDFAITPQDPTATISDDNNLPYWSYTDVNSDGKITCALVANATTASGYVLRWSVVGDGTLITGKSATMTRYVPIAGSRNRSFAYAAEAHMLSGGSSSAACSISLTMSFVTSAYVATGSSATMTSTFTDVALGLNFLQAPEWTYINPDAQWSAVTVPADAAYLEITMTVSTNATVSGGTKTIDCAEVRVMTAGAGLILPDLNDPATSAGAIWQDAGVLTIAPEMASAEGVMARILVEADITLDAPQGVTVKDGAGLEGEITADTVNAITAVDTPIVRNDATTTSDLVLQATGSDIVVQDTNVSNGTNPRILFRPRTGASYAGIKSGAANVIQILNGESATDYAQIWAERIYPMNGSTASRYIYDNGNQIALSSGGLDVNGVAYLSGSLFSDAISTTTQTSSAAIWVLSTGTTYSLRRNSSSARYKTEIEDVDDVVLEAARRIRPRHYRSTIADEDGATRLGFIAEEVEAAGLTHAVGYDADGRPESLDTTALIAALYARVDHLERRLAALEAASR